MTVEVTVLALPRSVAEDAAVHVSLFLAPRLAPDGVLGDFPPFDAWPDALAGADITLADQAGPYGIVPDIAADADDWQAVFPADTPVRAWDAVGLGDRELRSYPADEAVRAAKLVSAYTMAASPVAPPPPSGSPIVLAMLDIARRAGALKTTERGGLISYDERHATKYLDDLTGQGQAARGEGIEHLVSVAHLARRFFEREESQQPYQERPTTTSARLAPPPRDFHERLTLLGDQPALLRRLGIIVDLRVGDLDRLRAAKWLTATVAVPHHGDITVPTRVACRAVGDALVTVGLAGGDWRDGRLRVGDPERFATLDLDPDASGLKLDRFLWTTPRLAMLERKGEPAHAAPPTVRGHGFAIARAGRADELRQRHEDVASQLAPLLDAGDAPLLHTEDVARGVRVEVWDATVRRWFSLHSIRREVAVENRPPFAVEEDGWVQTGTVQETPGVDGGKVYVHESLFGWSGWSLSAPHPGLLLQHTYAGDTNGDDPERNEALAARQEALQTNDLHVVTATEAAAGTLPLLRYGREYALRAWAVDLAGASPAHALGAAASATADLESANASAPSTAPISATLLEALRTHVEPLLAARRAAAPLPTELTAELDAMLPRDATEVRRVALQRVAAQREQLRVTRETVTRRELVERALEPLLTGDEAPVVQLGSWSAALLDTVTPQLPLLRWAPVDPPVVVPRTPYTEGESVRHLVVRSDVDVVHHPQLGDEITVVPRGETSERHLAPPKVSQFECELHGRFDAAMSPAATAAERLAAMLSARREAGTFMDLTLPSLTDPDGEDPVDGIALVDSDGRVLPMPARTRGAALSEGQYVVHDVDELVLPYLPDPLARGLSFVFPDAGHDRPLTGLTAAEGTTLDYLDRDDWPALAPFRLVLSAARPLAAGADGRTIRLSLPPADVQRVRLSSALERAGLDLLGLWRTLPASSRANAALAEAAADGWLWALSPAEEMVFVHATSRPLQAPRPINVRAQRKPADTGTVLAGALDLHGPSTERVDAEATWTQQEDDVARARPDDDPGPRRHAVACTLQISAEEDLAVLGDTDVPLPGSVAGHRARHELGDTRHRVVDYRFRAATRFREYFPPPAVPADRTVIGRVARVSVPSSARPAKPVIRQVLPMFRWEESTEPEQPFARRRRRRAGVRIYLDRPWYSSGDGELLGVITGQPDDPRAAETLTSRWAADPMWAGRRPSTSAPMLQLTELWTFVGLDDRTSPARPVKQSEPLPLVDTPQRWPVVVLGYRPEFDADRGLWFADIAVDPGAVAWPFVRLAVCRYQPDSLPDMHLSPVVRCDYVQLPPERMATVSRPDERTARVVVSGPVVYRTDLSPRELTPQAGLDAARRVIGATRRVRARLERRLPEVGTDLGWETAEEVELRLEGFVPETMAAAWVGTLDLPTPLDPRRPDEPSDWRVTVLETELLPADPLPGEEPPIHQDRPVYVDRVEL